MEYSAFFPGVCDGAGGHGSTGSGGGDDGEEETISSGRGSGGPEGVAGGVRRDAHCCSH